MSKKIKNALISVFHKDGLDAIIKKLDQYGVKIYSTGGTYDFVKSLGINAETVESITGYPSILGGRVKTLHPSVFGGILGRRANPEDIKQMEQYKIPEFDLVIVDLYPFEKTVASGASEQEIIEKIDIGGISLIRAGAKNFEDVIIVPSVEQYPDLMKLLEEKNGSSNREDRRMFAAHAFQVSSHYDAAIFNYFNQTQNIPSFKASISTAKTLRYGENPHQQAQFFGHLEDAFEQIQGKEISYNNLLDIDAAVDLIDDFKTTTFAIIKHNNACGLASRATLLEAWKDALAGDPVSAFGGVLVTNTPIDESTAAEINKLFFEVLIAPEYAPKAFEILASKKNRIILKRKAFASKKFTFKTVLNGVIRQERDAMIETSDNLQLVTNTPAKQDQIEDLLFANVIVKHSKSNAIVLVKNKQLLASGVGQTSRVDALKQAIDKARGFGFELKEAVMASDAFFPFSDCVEISAEAGITAIVQPGGSVNDKLSVEACNERHVAMFMTGFRHFKH